MGKPVEDSLVGRTFEKCRIIAKLGTGGMGSVWLAEHFGLGRKVAVKILPTDMGRDPEYVARFMREATTAGRMEHPNIVQIHDVGYADGRHFIVMQYVDGESLSTVVEHLGAMEPKDAARIASGILRGLQHAHEEGVVHRDVKPDNVLITKGDEPKILDFGLAIETETALQITKDGMVVGTPYYLAPEQARGQKATPLSDIYAAGVTLYYLLTGKRPFVGATALAVLNKHIHDAAVPPMKLNPAVPKPLNDIVLKMMAKKPTERYQSAAAAANDLDAFLKGKEIKIDVPYQLPFKLPFKTPPFTKNQWIMVAAGAGGAFVLLVVLLAVLIGGSSATPTRTAETSTAAPAESPEAANFAACVQFEKEHRNDFASYPKILDNYDLVLRATTSKAWTEKANEAIKSFHDYAEKRADGELERIIKVSDPYERLKALDEYPKTLLELSSSDHRLSIERRLGEERGVAREQAESRFREDEKAIQTFLASGRFKEAAPLVDRLLAVADPARRPRLEKLKKDLPQMQRDYDDSALQRLTTAFAAVHKTFEDALIKRDNAAAYTAVAKFVSGLTDTSDRLRVRIQEGLNYDAVLAIVPDNVLTDGRLGTARSSLSHALGKAEASLPYLILTDLEDALDVEFLIRLAGMGLKELSKSKAEIRLATFNASGTIGFGSTGLVFVPRGGGERPIKISELHPRDLILMAAAGLGMSVDDFEMKDDHCRAAGAAYLYSVVPERWAEAARWLRKAEGLGISGLGFRLESFRNRGYEEVRDRILKAKAEQDKKNFVQARKLLLDVESAWSHDPSLKLEISRAMATLLTAEVRHCEKGPDYPRLKEAARLLRTKYAEFYDEEAIRLPYANAMRQTGSWTPAGNLLNDDWTWAGKGQKAEAPVVDETLQARGLRLKPEAVLRRLPVRFLREGRTVPQAGRARHGRGDAVRGRRAGGEADRAGLDGKEACQGPVDRPVLRCRRGRPDLLRRPPARHAGEDHGADRSRHLALGVGGRELQEARNQEVTPRKSQDPTSEGQGAVPESLDSRRLSAGVGGRLSETQYSFTVFASSVSPSKSTGFTRYEFTPRE